MSKKLTPWFPFTEKPVRVGYYDRMWGVRDMSPDYWNGEAWENGFGDGTRDGARFSSQELPWRGLAKKP